MLKPLGKKIFVVGVGSFILFATMAPQSYTPAPPPALPKVLSEEAIRKGEALFVGNFWPEGKVEIHNYLGPVACASCHDEKKKLKGKSLAKNFSKLRDKINQEIVEKSGGSMLPLRDPAMESLVQYFIRRYRLQEYKILE